ncbi:hypothetical protein GCM10023161_45090 [Mycobacterium paraffinicum]|uniref:Uncharacterized protein n=1 Tax=Mycobacterium paraffinicum TaxID=53378 RepID=A0ABP8F4L6_9MYCO
MAGEQFRNGHGRGRRLDQDRPVAELIQPGMLGGIQHVHRRQPLVRVGGHRVQHAFEPLDECGDGCRVEQIAAELDRAADAGGLARLGEAFGKGERQVHAGGVGVHRHLGGLHIA